MVPILPCDFPPLHQQPQQQPHQEARHLVDVVAYAVALSFARILVTLLVTSFLFTSFDMLSVSVGRHRHQSSCIKGFQPSGPASQAYQIKKDTHIV
jgi:hypothetical protein